MAAARESAAWSWRWLPRLEPAGQMQALTRAHATQSAMIAPPTALSAAPTTAPLPPTGCPPGLQALKAPLQFAAFAASKRARSQPHVALK
jgi:hypothetical protein